MDLAAHAVSVDGVDVHLTPTEFSLLRVLVLNRGLLMTHRQLLTEVWGPEHADATPVLRTHIANLRSKLQAGGTRTAADSNRLRYRLSLQRLATASHDRRHVR